MSPTQLTLKLLRDQGWTAEVTEHFVSFPPPGHRKDLFHIIDVLAVRGDQTMGVQTTSHTNVASRIRKIGDSPHIGAIREAGWTIRVHGWRKVKGRWLLWRDEDVS